MNNRPRVFVGVSLLLIVLGVVLDRCVFAPADFDQIYRLTLARAVKSVGQGATSVALICDRNQKFTPLPATMLERLQKDWRRNGIDVEAMIPPDRVETLSEEVVRSGVKGSEFRYYIDSKTHQTVRVFVIDSICWLGKDEILVTWSATHACLDAVRATFRLKRIFGIWKFIEETERWIA